MRRERRKKPASVRSQLAMRVLSRVLLSILPLTPAASLGQTTDLADRSALRVCADPANMPFSNDKEQGFENKIADLLARKLNVPVIYTWFPQAIGFVRNTLGARKCDLVIGFPQGDELVQNTNAYYRSAYALVYRTDSPLAGVATLDDPRLKGKSIGVIARTPPVTIMAMNGLLGTAESFQLVVDRRYSSPGEEMVAAVANGELDAGVLWGPIGGYYAKLSPVPMSVVPLVKETKGPRMAFRITMGIRPREPDWKHKLNNLIATSQDEINAILLDFGVPILTENDEPIRR
jgi:quinoprotein dehydrogenase-associated probable ABC transporter substrate-binding protein